MPRNRTVATEESIRVLLDTDMGRIVAELYPTRAPATTANFLRYLDEGHYGAASIYRTMRPGAGARPNRVRVVQGGVDPSCRNPPLPSVPLESTDVTGLRHVDGTLSIARWEPETGASEFFIVIGDGAILDHGGDSKPDGQGFAAFGRIVEGMDIVRRINDASADAPTEHLHMEGQALTAPVALRMKRLP